MEPKIEDNKLSTPIAIVFAGILIAGAVLYSNRSNTITNNAPQQQAQVQAVQGGSDLDQMRAITNDDHIRGDKNAQVLIVEYSDTECPFCKQFHATMKQVIAEYGADSRVAWVYRHSPIEQLHSKAPKEAEALECAGELGGNDKFWQYTDRIYEITPANNGLDSAELPKIAQYVGLDVAKFNTCLLSGKYADKVQKDLDNATVTIGGNIGTPWSIVVSKNGKKSPLSGAQPYSLVKQAIDNALADK